VPLSVTTGDAVYHGSIVIEDVAMKECDATILAGFLLGTTTILPVKPHCVYTLSQDDQEIQVVIKYLYKTRPSTAWSSGGDKTEDDEDEDEVAMKKAWSGSLTRDIGDNAFLEFCKTLGHCINQRQETLQKNQQITGQLQKDRDSWRRTALKLEGAWQQEKTIMLQNFCTLYNQTHQTLVENQTNLQLMQQQQKQAPDALLAKKRRITQKTPPPPLEPQQEEKDAAPLPQLQDLFDEDMVSALANGKRVPMGSSNSNRSTTNIRRPCKRKLQSDSGSDTDTRRASRKRTQKAKVSFQPQKPMAFDCIKRPHSGSDGDGDSKNHSPTKVTATQQPSLSKTINNSSISRYDSNTSDNDSQSGFGPMVTAMLHHDAAVSQASTTNNTVASAAETEKQDFRTISTKGSHAVSAINKSPFSDDDDNDNDSEDNID
jgi:hypothetical protein